MRPRLPDGARAGAVAAAAMIAQQVAGKAARDALYLSTFDVRTLPAMMASSAVVSLLAVVWLSRQMVRRSPIRVVPIVFMASGAAFLAEWAIGLRAPAVAAVVLYLHTALFGAAVISAFWSLVNETFVPHTGRSAVAWIAGGGTVGGVFGGLAAWAAAGAISVMTLLPILAVVNVLCVWGVRRLGAVGPVTAAAPEAKVAVTAPLRIFRGAPFLRGIALVVALGALTSGLLDYLFSAAAARTYTEGHQLLAFFALFWLVVGVLSVAFQLLLGRVSLERLGLAVTVSLLPGAVVVGGVAALALPGLWSMAVLRGAEATQRNSLTRTASELLYTPLPESTKRPTKALIDVGFDRLGTITASGIVMAALFLSPAHHVEVALLAVAIGASLVVVVRTRALQRHYVAVLEDGLRKAGPALEPAPAAVAAPAQAKIDVRDRVLAQLDEIRSARPDESVERVLEPDTSTSQIVRSVRDLTSGDAVRIRRVLHHEVLSGPLVALAIALLAEPEVHPDAIRALRRVAAKATGQLVDALCDAGQGYDVRRRIPRVLSGCATQQAAEGLLRGLDDERFEVRYACGRALLQIVSTAAISIGLPRVMAAVEREATRARPLWESQVLDEGEDEDEQATCLVDRLVRDRIDRGMEHLFNLLALHLDPSSLRTAFNALHAEDPRLRGTALEYLETVLPVEVRDLVWPVLGEARPMRAARPAVEILADLESVRSSS